MTLTEYLLERIAEDEDWLADASGDLEWCQECGFGHQPESPYSLSRLTADCEAKRRIIDEAFRVAAAIDGEWGCCHSSEEIRTGVTDDGEPLPASCSGPGAAEPFLKPLAAIYAAHPDYQPEWAPELENAPAQP